MLEFREPATGSRLRESRGSVLDHLYVARADEVRRHFGLACGS